MNNYPIQFTNTDTPLTIAENSSLAHHESKALEFDLSGCVQIKRSHYIFWKNIFDRILAALGIIILIPFLIIISMAIRLDSPGSILFRREQVGEKGKSFIAYKFRTMIRDNDDSEYKSYLVRYILKNAPYKINQDGSAIYKVVDDPRVTKVGSFLRKTNLDELPQLINVLKGQMSFVGPRPDIPFALSMYKKWHLQRLNAKPGITGLWQVCGRKELPFEGMVRLDLSYIKRQSLALDMKIVLLTLFTILKGDGS
jgi:lipopolysaccharide/colanic/teichoic acid biosynthesis glycosyltransferase